MSEQVAHEAEQLVARRRMKAPERRELILRAAARAFHDDGYEGASLDRIAAAAGVTKPIIYRHFGNKQKLYLALLRRHRDDLSVFLADLPADEPLETVLDAVLDVWLDYAREHPHGWRMLFRDGGGGAEIDAMRREVNGRASAVIAGFLREFPAFALPAEEVEPTAELVTGGLATMVMWWHEHPEIDKATMLTSARRLVLGLARDPRPVSR